MIAAQLPLHLRWREHPELDDFLPGANAAARDAVLGLATGASGVPPVLLHGPAAVGKTHLLLAACQAAGSGAAYLPLGEVAGREARPVTTGLEKATLLCLDDLQAVAGRPHWEEALFHLYNRCESSGARLLMSATRGPATLALGLPDLRSRLAACLAFRLQPLDDVARAAVLRARARRRGLELPVEVADYLLARQARDLHSLLALLDRIDEAALAGKRRLSVPLVREVLERAGG